MKRALIERERGLETGSVCGKADTLHVGVADVPGEEAEVERAVALHQRNAALWALSYRVDVHVRADVERAAPCMIQLLPWVPCVKGQLWVPELNCVGTISAFTTTSCTIISWAQS